MNLKKIGKVFTSKFVGTGPLSYEKRIYRAAVSQRLRNTALQYTDILTLQYPPRCTVRILNKLFLHPVMRQIS